MAYIQVGLWLGATARGYRGPRPLRRERATRECAPPSSHKLTRKEKHPNHKKTTKQRVPQSRHLCVSWNRAGYLRSGMEGPAWDLHPPVCLPGRGDCRVTLHAPPPRPTGTHPRGGAAGGRPGARQPPGPPVPVAVVTARANWPVEPAGGSCSDLEGQGHRSPGHWVQRGGNIQRPEHPGEGCEDGYFKSVEV